MSAISLLDTVSFQATLPLSMASLSTGNARLQQQRETQLVLQVLTTQNTEPASGTDPFLQRLEAKLDLILEIGLISRPHPSLTLTRCEFGLEAMIWYENEAVALNQSYLLVVQAAPHSALTLYLVVQIVDCRAVECGFQLLADIRQSFDNETSKLWEKWVFRCHRRAIVECGDKKEALQ